MVSVWLDLYKLKGYMAERQGEREDMQDAHIIINDVLSCQLISSLPNKMYVNITFDLLL